MPETRRKLSNEEAPDPARTYERAKPEAEGGMGRLDNNGLTGPTRQPDKMEHAATNRQKSRQLNADDVVNAANGAVPENRRSGKRATGPASRDEVARQKKQARRSRPN